MLKVNELVRATGGRLLGGSNNPVLGRVVIDSRNIKRGDVFVAIKGDKFDGHNFIPRALKQGASCIVKERNNKVVINKNISVIEVKDTKIALADIAKLYRSIFNVPLIAITGSCGKTTTKDMLSWILSEDFKILTSEGTKNNHIGVPLTLFRLDASHRMAVLELGTNHFGEIDYLANICQPNIAVITNVGPAHLKYFNSLEGVFKEKISLLDSLHKPRVAVLNADDQFLSRRIRRNINGFFTIGFSMRNKSDFTARVIKRTNSSITFNVNNKFKVRLNNCGYQNIYNALAAIAVARLFGVKYSDIVNRLESFSFPQGRLNFIKFKDIDFIDDTYNANPFSLQLALDALKNLRTPGRKIFVMGDMLELGKQEETLHRQAGEDIAKICDTFVSVGGLARISGLSAKDCGLAKENIYNCISSIQARKLLFERLGIKKGDVVLIKGSRRMKMDEILKCA